MSELELIIDLHKNSERQGPGSKNDTLRALNFLTFPSEKFLKVADIGCGSGGQTLTLAENLNAQIIAVDLFQEFLDELNENSSHFGLNNKIKTLQKTMKDLPFEDEEFDVIWSEGAIYNIGFEKGIKTWKNYLKHGGYLAVSEITWITATRPIEIEDFWEKEYPEIDKASNKIKLLEDNGFSLAGYFYLSEDSWIRNYYKPMQERFDAFLERNKDSKLADKVVEENRAEIELYMKYKDFFSYGFYIAKKN